MNPRFFTDQALVSESVIELPDQAARHVQVLRLQPGDSITLFNSLGNGTAGSEGAYQATIERMGRSDVRVIVGHYSPSHREARRDVHLAIGMPANERMDWLVEKATELGVASIRPLMAERSVLRLKGDRSDKKLAHWRGIAAAACEQCGRNRVPVIHDTGSLVQWLKPSGAAGVAVEPEGSRLLLSLQPGSRPLAQALADADAGDQVDALTFLSGPEGGLSAVEEAAALACGFAPVSLGPRVLRAETAPLAVLSFLALLQH
ncbi:MAG: rRNA ((1498)-N(3))-methyltransferase [Polaromonas sp.]|nr:rRNA ((1498)-N(3))-methyltransferase [Polaromonas sp.]